MMHHLANVLSHDDGYEVQHELFGHDENIQYMGVMGKRITFRNEW
jgi:hypothetical protein